MDITAHPELARMLAGFKQFTQADLVTVERRYEELAHGPRSYYSDNELERLRARLQTLYAERDRRLGLIAVERERAELVDIVKAARSKEIAEATAVEEAIKASAGDPDQAQIKDLAVRTRRIDGLNRVLHAATGEPEFAKAIDFIDRVKWHWHSQRIARDRIFSHVLAPVMRSQLTAAPPAWADAAARLSRLPSPKEEVTHG